MQPCLRIPSRVSLDRLRPGKIRVALLEEVDDAQGLAVVIEASVLRHQNVEHPLARMGEGRVAQVVGERDCLGEVFVEAERTSERAGDLGILEGVGRRFR